MGETYYCPVNAWDCPYWCENGECAMGGAAINECDDAALMEKELEPNEIIIFGGNCI